MDCSLEVVWAFMVDYAKDWGVRRHSHSYFQMYYCLSGHGNMFLGGKDITIKQNECLIIWPDQVHELYPVESGQLRIIDTKFYVHDQKLYDALLKAPQLITAPNAQFRELQQSMRNEWVTDAPYAKRMATLLFEQSILLFLRDNMRIPMPPQFYQDLRRNTEKLTGLEKTLADYLSVHFLEDLSLDEISKHLSYSKNYLCRIFKQSSGFTISEYINYLRIVKAYDLVCYTNLRLTEISAQCGFSSIHYFSRMFHRIVGMTPTQARDQEQNFLYTDARLHGAFSYRYFSKGSGSGTGHNSPEANSEQKDGSEKL